MASNRADVTRVPLPPGVKASSVVGRGGQNVKWLHLQSGGAHITVNDTGVVIRTKDEVVRARAEQLVRRQLEVAGNIACQSALAGARTELVLLDSAFGIDPCVCFQQRQDEVTQAAGYRDKLYHLVPQEYGNYDGSEYGTPCGESASPQSGSIVEFGRQSNRSEGGSSSTGSTLSRDEETERDQDQDPVGPTRYPGRRLTTHPSTTTSTTVATSTTASNTGPAARISDGGSSILTQRFHVTSAAATSTSTDPACTAAPCTSLSPLQSPMADIAAALGAAVHAAAYQQSYRCEALKLKFKLGKALFRNLAPRLSRSAFRIGDLQALTVSSAGRSGFLSTWSNVVPAAAVPRITEWLTRHLGFRQVAAKCAVALHVINQELNVPYKVGLVLQDGRDASACLRKLKAGGGRNLAVALLAAPDQYDLRFKLESRHGPQQAALYDNDAATTAQRVAAAVRSEGFHGFMRSRRGLPRHRILEYGRRTSKCVYEGTFQVPGPSAGEGNSGSGSSSQSAAQQHEVHRMRVSVCRVEDDSGEHWEVSGSLPDMDMRLGQLLRWRRPPPPQQWSQQARYHQPPQSPTQSWGALRHDGGGRGRCSAAAGGGGEQSVGEDVAAAALAALTAFVTELNTHAAAATEDP